MFSRRVMEQDATYPRGCAVRTVPQPKRLSPLSHDLPLLQVPFLTPQGSITFRQTRTLLLPDRPGVYLIDDLRGALYRRAG
jgi:hypothetical protein